MPADASAPKTNRYQLEALLLADLHSASERRRQTVTEFLEVTAEVPHDSTSDGLLLIKLASDARQKALAGYQTALKRFTEFVVNGIVPDDLK